MANHKSALKRARQNDIRKIRNAGYKTRARKAVKTVRTAIADQSEEQANANLRNATAIIQKSISKGVMHKKTGARKISRLARQANQIASSTQSPTKG